MRLEELQQLKPQILAIVHAHKAGNLRVFGSVARGDARPESDVDFLVHLEEGASLLDLAQMDYKLGALLGVRADVVDDSCLHPVAAPYILAEAVPL